MKTWERMLWYLNNALDYFVMHDHFYKKETKKLLKERKKNVVKIL